MFGSGEFSTSTTDSIFRTACEIVGLDPTGAHLIRLGENAIYAIESTEIVVRIARSSQRLDRVERELCIARWLKDHDVPAVEVHEDIEQPITADGLPVTFWKLIHESPPKPRHQDLAELLAKFHALEDCPCELPEFQPLALVRSRIASAQAVSAEHRNFLLEHYRDLSERYEQLEFALPTGPIHGDAWPGNLLRDERCVRLLDFEMSGFGPREWDLIPTSVATRRYGLPKEDYQAFSTAYGFDVMQWSGYPTLRDIREMTMTTWLMQNVQESPEIKEEFQNRVDSIVREDFDRAWRIF